MHPQCTGCSPPQRRRSICRVLRRTTAGRSPPRSAGYDRAFTTQRPLPPPDVCLLLPLPPPAAFYKYISVITDDIFGCYNRSRPFFSHSYVSICNTFTDRGGSFLRGLPLTDNPYISAVYAVPCHFPLDISHHDISPRKFLP